MPRTPILSREAFYTKLRDGSFRDLDWNLVNTSLGGMVEPRQMVAGHLNGKQTNVDIYDASFTRRTEIDENVFFLLMNTAGHQVPLDYSR